MAVRNRKKMFGMWFDPKFLPQNHIHLVFQTVFPLHFHTKKFNTILNTFPTVKNERLLNLILFYSITCCTHYPDFVENYGKAIRFINKLRTFRVLQPILRSNICIFF